MHFLEWKLLNFKQNFTEICSLGSNWQYGSIGSVACHRTGDKPLSEAMLVFCSDAYICVTRPQCVKWWMSNYIPQIIIWMQLQWRPFIARFIIANILWSSILISLHNMVPFELTKDTPYLALSGELWSVFYEYFNRNWSCYKGFLLYLYMLYKPKSQTNYVSKRGPSSLCIEIL